MSEEIIVVELAEQPIELCKLLKAANLVGGGGEAKMVISEGYVYVNNEVEFQKRKKIYDQDIVEFNGEQIIVECSAPITQKSKKPKTPKESSPAANKSSHRHSGSKNKNKNNSSQSLEQSTKNNNPQGRRRPINF